METGTNASQGLTEAGKDAEKRVGDGGGSYHKNANFGQADQSEAAFTSTYIV